MKKPVGIRDLAMYECGYKEALDDAIEAIREIDDKYDYYTFTEDEVIAAIEELRKKR